MPKSKRAKVVSLTKTRKKGKEAKEALFALLQECLEIYSNIYLYSVDNMRNSRIKEIRQDWQDKGRFFMGKNKIIALAFGKTKAEEKKPGLHELTKRIRGNCGLFFSDADAKEVQTYFEGVSEKNFARSGALATATFTLPKGPLEHFSHALEPQLRKLGLTTSLKNGVIHLLADTTVCQEGQVLTPEQCKILELFDQRQAVFRVHVHAVHSDDNEDSPFTLFSEPDLVAAAAAAAAEAEGAMADEGPVEVEQGWTMDMELPGNGGKRKAKGTKKKSKKGGKRFIPEGADEDEMRHRKRRKTGGTF